MESSLILAKKILAQEKDEEDKSTVSSYISYLEKKLKMD